MHASFLSAMAIPQTHGFFSMTLLVLLLLPISHDVFAQTKTSTRIAVGISLYAMDNSSWISPSGDFAYGF